jgi:hypothetical protein
MPEIRTAILKPLHYVVQHAISTKLLDPNKPLGEVELRTVVEPTIDAMVFQLSTWLYGQVIKDETVSWPLNWREAFKERWFPDWALRKWPVLYAYHHFKLTEVYPTIRLPKGQASVQIHVLESDAGTT